jgi:transposase
MPRPPAAPLQVRPSVRRELEALVTKPTAPQRAVRRALVLLDAADGTPNALISRQRKITREHVIAIRRRFEERGIESVYQDAAGRGRPKEMTEDKAAKIVATTIQRTPKNATHWTGDEMARRFGVSSSTVYRLWRAHNLQPHRV